MSRSQLQLANEYKKVLNTLERRAYKAYFCKGRRGHGFNEQIIIDTISSFTRSSLSINQLTAVAKWKQWYPRWRGPEAGKAPMLEFINIMNDIFFMGQLPSMDFVWTVNQRGFPSEWKDHNSIAMAIMGYWLSKRPHGWSQVQQQMLVAKDHHSLKESGVDRNASLVSTVLHECVHAYIMHYNCVSRGCQNGKCLAAYKIWYGKLGHGPAFLYLAAAIEGAAVRHLNFNVSLGIFDSLLYEDELSQGSIRQDLNWWRLFFGNDDVYRQILSSSLADERQWIAESLFDEAKWEQLNMECFAELPFKLTDDGVFDQQGRIFNLLELVVMIALLMVVWKI